MLGPTAPGLRHARRFGRSVLGVISGASESVLNTMFQTIKPMDYLEIGPAGHIFIVRDRYLDGKIRARLSYIRIQSPSGWPFTRVASSAMSFPEEDGYNVVARAPDDVHIETDPGAITAHFPRLKLSEVELGADDPATPIVHALLGKASSLARDDFSLIGSRLFATNGYSTDVDLVFSALDRIDDLKRAIEDLVLEGRFTRVPLSVDARFLDRLRSKSQRFLLRSHRRQWFRKYSFEERAVVGFSFADPYWRPGPRPRYLEQVSLRARVIDASRSYSFPCIYLVAPSHRDSTIPLKTYVWAYRHAFEEGDAICISGQFANTADETVLLVDRDGAEITFDEG